MKAVRRAVPAARPVASPEHEFEAAFGLPEPLPATERILWQGQPQVGAIMRRVFHMRVVALYFAALLAWSAATAIGDGVATAPLLRSLATLGGLSLTALALLAGLAWLTARTAVYTLTDRRVVMRIGIVLTVTYNFPLRCMDGAHVLRTGGGRGEIALQLQQGTRIAWLHLWPHARPWHLREPQPLLRGLADVEQVGRILGEAWAAANGQAASPGAAPAPARPSVLPPGLHAAGQAPGHAA